MGAESRTKREKLKADIADSGTKLPVSSTEDLSHGAD